MLQLKLFIFLIQLLLESIICKEVKGTDLKKIAVIVSRNLERFSLQNKTNFNYKKEYIIDNQNYSIKLCDIQPLLFISDNNSAVDETAKTIVYKNLKINYKFNIQVVFKSNSNNNVAIQRNNILASQTIEIKFIQNTKDKLNFTLKLDQCDSCEKGEIEFLTKMDLFELRIIKDINFSSDDIKNILRSSLIDYLKNVILYYPESTALSYINSVREELIGHGKYIISPRNNIKSITFKEIEYELDEDYIFKMITCNVDFRRYNTAENKDQYIYIINATFDDDGKINFEEENIITSFEYLVSNIRFYLRKSVKELFDNALISKDD